MMSGRLSERRKILLFSLMALGLFMSLLDVQIVASSMGKIQASLAAAPDEISWVQTAYLMSGIVMIPLSGWLSRLLSTRWLFTLSAVGFTVSSMACGFAWNIEAMVAARAIQGFVGGAMVPVAFAAGFTLFQGRSQALVPAILGVLGTLAPTIGPTLGGWLTETLSWHWIFFINLVPGGLISIAVPLLGRIDEPDPSLLRRCDVIGLVLLAVSLGSLEYVFEEGYRWNWFEDETIRSLAWAGTISGVFFVWRSLVHPNPLVDLRALGNRTFAVACVFNFVSGFGIFASIYILPLFLGRVRGFNAQQIGDAVFVAGLAMVASTPISAFLLRRIDLRLMIAFGLALFALGIGLMSAITSEWTGAELFWPQVIRGFSVMFCVVPATNMALGSLPLAQLKMASALFSTTRNLGGAIGIACVNTWLNDRTNFHWLRLCENLTGGRPLLGAWLDTLSGHMERVVPGPGLADPRALATLSSLTRREAATMAYADVLWLMAVLFFGTLILVPLVRVPQRPAASEGQGSLSE